MIHHWLTGCTVQPVKLFSFAHVSGYRSAIVSVIKKQGSTVPDALSLAMEDYLIGYKKNIADLKEAGQWSTVEGKAPFSFEAYIKVCKAAMLLENRVSIPLWIMLRWIRVNGTCR
jgi:hypothetical protein